MVIEKIKKYGVAMVVFFVNVMFAAGGVFFFKSRDAQKAQEAEQAAQLVAQAQADAENTQATADATMVQDGINADRQAKLDSIAKNSGQVVQQQPQKVVQTIPPKTVTTTKPSTSTSTSSSSSKTTKTS